MIAAAVAAAAAAATWGITQILGHLFEKAAALASGDAPVVLGLYLTSAVPSVLAAVCLAVGIGFARHRAVGTVQIQAGIVGAAAITLGALLWGVVGASAATLVRDGTLLALARRVIAPPDVQDLRPSQAQART